MNTGNNIYKNAWSIFYDAGQKRLDVYFGNGAGTTIPAIYTAANTVNPNGWNAVELYVNQATSGGAQVWLNGVSAGSTGTVDLSYAPSYSRACITISPAQSSLRRQSEQRLQRPRARQP